MGFDGPIAVASFFAEPALARLCFKSFGVCELLHIGAGKNMRILRQAQRDIKGVQMLAWIIGGVVAIGLIWSVAAMTNLVPLDGSDSAVISQPAQ